MRPERCVADELVQHGLLPDVGACLGRLVPGHASSRASGDSARVEQLLEGQLVSTEPASDPAQDAVGQPDQRGERDQQGSHG